MSFNKFLKYALIGGIFAVPFIPLIVSSTMFFPFITAKNFTFRIIVELMLGGWIILALRDSTYRPRFSWLLFAIALFVGVMAVADFFGENPFKSFWSNFERMEGLVTLIHLLAYTLVVSAVLHTEKLWNWLFSTSIAVSGILGVYGLFQLAGKTTIHQGGVRLDATLGNATYFAIYMFFHIFITAIMFVRWRGPSYVKYVYGAFMALQIFTLYHTATRGAILGFLGGTIVTALLIVFLGREYKVLRKISIGVLLGIVLLIGGFLMVKDTTFVTDSQVLSRLASISLEEESNTRFIIWSMAWQGVKERPLLGWGQESFNYVFNKYYDPRLYAQEPWFDRVHNVILDWMIAGGVLGVLAYLLIPLSALWYLWRRSTTLSLVEKSLFTGMLLGYGFHNLFVFDNIISYILFFTILAYIHHLNGQPFRERTTRFFSLNEGVRDRVVPALVILVMVGAVYFLNVKGIQTSRTLIQGLSPQSSGIDTNIAHFNKALTYNTLGNQEVIEQLVATATKVREANLDISIQTKFFDQARPELEKLISQYPNDTRLRLFAAAFFNQYAFYDEALIHLQKASELSPNKQTVYFEFGTSYLNTREYDKAFELFEYAYNLDTSFKNARSIYAIGAIYAGHDDIADSIIDLTFSEFDEGVAGLQVDDRVLRAYMNSGKVDKVISILERTVERQPKNKQYRLSLAASYLDAGQRTRAIQEVRSVIEFDPTFKEEGEQHIQKIQQGI